MVNRCRSAGFFLTLSCLSLLVACSGGNTSGQNVSQENEPTTIETEADSSSNTSSTEVPIKIMALGDSITQADADHKSYRYALWKKLVDTGVAFDMVGSMQGNYKGNPSWPDYKLLAFDRDHEGHWGWRVDEILAEVDAWLNQNTPDIALIHLGTNDVFQIQSNASTLTELTELIARFRAKNASVAMLLSEVIPSKFHNLELDELNIGIADLAQKLSTAESPIYLVDTGIGFDPESDTYDGVHPDESGEEKMADLWFEGILSTEKFR